VTASETVLLDVADRVARITLNRPAVLNALDSTMVEGLRSAIERIAADASVRAVVLGGAGKGFMAGGDVKWFNASRELPPAERSARFERLIHEVHATLSMLRRLPQPVIARVHGPAAGFGLSLVMAADLAVAADDAMFTLAYCHIGTSPDGGSTWFLPRHVGLKKAMEIALLGDRFGAPEALRLGLVNEVVPAAELDARVAALAARLAAGPALAYEATKRLLLESLDNSLETQLHREAASFAGCVASADFVEGVGAFAEKRKPRFTGT
jgi:2-(1,2-epoxy-1,2-dihydrophenyl)acetyl-CoA isomerase